MTTDVITAVGTIGFLAVVAASVGFATRGRRRDRLAQREVVVRAALFRTLAEPGEATTILDHLVAADRRLLEAKSRALLPLLRGEDHETLARLLESRGAIQEARHQCRSHHAPSRAAAAQLLGDVGNSFAVLDLAPLLDDPRWVVRLAAARALGRLGEPSGVVPLLQAVNGPHPLPVDVAADAIQSIRGWPLSLLVPCLSNSSERTRAVAVELVGRSQATESVPALIQLLERDPAPAVRVRAARALGLIGMPQAVKPLIASLLSASEPLQAEAVAALGRLGDATAVPALRPILLGSSRPLSQAAAAALAAIDPEGVDVLREIANDDHHANGHPAGSTARRALVAAALGG